MPRGRKLIDAASRKKATTINNDTTKMPERVLAITCDKRPQRLHAAGFSRLDHLVAMDVMPSPEQCGQSVTFFMPQH
jgi:hypothetical protein